MSFTIQSTCGIVLNMRLENEDECIAAKSWFLRMLQLQNRLSEKSIIVPMSRSGSDAFSRALSDETGSQRLIPRSESRKCEFQISLACKTAEINVLPQHLERLKVRSQLLCLESVHHRAMTKQR